jgi:hypothetical protein
LLSGRQLLLGWYSNHVLSLVRKVAENKPSPEFSPVNHSWIWSLPFLEPEAAKIVPRNNVQYFQHLLDGFPLGLNRTN